MMIKGKENSENFTPERSFSGITMSRADEFSLGKKKCSNSSIFKKCN